MMHHARYKPTRVGIECALCKSQAKCGCPRTAAHARKMPDMLNCKGNGSVKRSRKRMTTSNENLNLNENENGSRKRRRGGGGCAI